MMLRGTSARLSVSASPEEFNAFVQADARRWTKIIKENAVKID